ncbi:MAG: hypothetical protein V1708_02615 [Candidatus Micrarchaeota archaeon]
MKRSLLDAAWAIDYEHAKGGVWWWWFWLVFLKNPSNPDKPMQLMVLWSTKKEPHFKCNGVDIRFDQTILRKGQQAVFDGAVASWFFDGKRMRENFILTQALLVLDAKERSIRADGASTSEKGGVFTASVHGSGAKIDFVARPFNGAGKPMHVMNTFVKKFSYNITKVNELAVEGTLEIAGKKRKVGGTAYFQRVIVKAPVMPWLWSIVHFADGSCLSYFCPRMGTSLVKKDVGSLHSNVHFKSKLEFFCAQDGSYREFRPCRISSDRNAGRARWKFAAHSAGESLEAELEAYSEAGWKIQNSLGGIFRNALHYDEYCVNATRLVFRRAGKPDYTLKQAGKGWGNAEHSWGFII